MGTLKERLIRKAIRRHSNIFPCETKAGFGRSFTRANGRLLFWYNSADDSTHVVSGKINPSRRIPVRKPQAKVQGAGTAAATARRRRNGNRPGLN
jgi:hypothetical protein